MLQGNDALDLATLAGRYAAGRLRPSQTVTGILERLARRGDDRVWIHRLPDAELQARAAELERRGAAGLPLYGIPFAIKDNIDSAGHPTTAACREFAVEYIRLGRLTVGAVYDRPYVENSKHWAVIAMNKSEWSK